MNIIKEANINAIDKFNIKSVPQDIKKLTEAVTVVGAIIYNDVDRETGELKNVGAIKTSNGDIYGFTSMTLIDCTDLLIDTFKDGAKEITLIPVTGTSNAGRTFYQFRVMDIK